jgi:hypothetical protein
MVEENKKVGPSLSKLKQTQTINNILFDIQHWQHRQHSEGTEGANIT